MAGIVGAPGLAGACNGQQQRKSDSPSNLCRFYHRTAFRFTKNKLRTLGPGNVDFFLHADLANIIFFIGVRQKVLFLHSSFYLFVSEEFEAGANSIATTSTTIFRMQGAPDVYD